MTVIYTIGHGNRSIGEFVGLLQGPGIECLLDVRAHPASRRHPQFTREALERSLFAAGIRYAWEGRMLGGRRRPAADSPHAALVSPGFRAYADYMSTPQFREGARRLIEAARSSRMAILCAERLPWACHRFLISDHLVAAGGEVVHLIHPGPGEPHRLSPLARQCEGRLIYDGGVQEDLKLE